MGQDGVYSIQRDTTVGAFRKMLPLVAFAAGAFHQKTDVEIVAIFNPGYWGYIFHFIFSLSIIFLQTRGTARQKWYPLTQEKRQHKPKDR